MEELKLIMSRAVSIGSVRLISEYDLELAVAEARRNSFPILGIDGFFVIGNAIRPSLSDSVDFKDEGSSPLVYDWALDFLDKRRSKGMFFEIVFPFDL